MLKFEYFIIIFFIFFFILSRFLFPFSDVPDITVQTAYFNKTFGFIFNYLNFNITMLNYQNVYSNCGIVASKFSLWSYINQVQCVVPIKTIIFNLFYTFILLIPFVFIQFKRNFFYSISFYNKQLYDPRHWNNFIDATSLSFCFAGFIYILGFISLESITLVLSIYVIIFLNNIIIIIPLIILIFFLDTGSFVIIITFVSFYYFYLILSIFFNMVNIFIIVIALFVSIYFLQDYLFYFLLDNDYFEIPLSYHFLISSFVDSSLDSENAFTVSARKYPIILRPIITYMSAIYLSGMNVKVPLVYIYNFFGIASLIYLTFKFILNSNFKSNEFFLYKRFYLIPLIAAITTILLLVFMFPNNAYAKYYIFLLPFFFNYTLVFFDRFKILQYIFVNNFLVFYFLMLYSI